MINILEVKFPIMHTPYYFLFILFAGTLFFIPSIFVDRFISTPTLWIQGVLGITVIIYVLLTKIFIPLPPKSFIFLMLLWIIYHIWQNRENIENIIDIIVLVTAFLLFYAIWLKLKDWMMTFVLFAFLALTLSLWGLGQLAGLLPSCNSSFVVTGPFDNPAGISASLAVMLPFSLYCCIYLKKKCRLFAIVTTCIVVIVIVFLQARAAILATVFVFVFIFVHLLRKRNIKLSKVHYAAMFLGCILLIFGLFFIKKDSANGRLLIWRCTGQLIACKPLFGYGGNGFTANYMNEQASYFNKQPNSKYTILADNIRHPFNEFLKCTVNFGITGLSLSFLLVIFPLWVSLKNDLQGLFFIRIGIFAIIICAFFSYPFNYPFIRLFTVALLALALAANPKKSITITNGYLSKGITMLFSLGLLFATAHQAYYEREWHMIANKSLMGATIQMLPRYESLYKHLFQNDLFLYNYAAELNVVAQYDKSLQIAQKCNKLWADYDLEMLMADNCMEQQLYDETEIHLKTAAAMCPVKFMPLYKLVMLYSETGRNEEARILAQKILKKNVKTPSPVIDNIKNKMYFLLTVNKDILNDSS